MKTTTLHDAQSRANLVFAAGNPKANYLIVIEGPRASGKTTTAREILRAWRAKRDLRPHCIREYDDIQIGLAITNAKRFVFFDEFVNRKSTGRWKSVIPLDHPAILGARDQGIGIIIAGESVILSPELERIALRIRLSANNPQPQ